MFRILPAIMFVAMATTSFADVITIEGFEDFNDPGNWQVHNNTPSTPGQTQNATVSGQVPEYVTTNITEGTQAGKFTAAWTSAAAADANPYISTDPLIYWSVRYNVNAPSGLPLNSIPSGNGYLQADIRNDSAYPVSVAIVTDSPSSSHLKRGPFLTIPANSGNVYTWDFSVTAPVPLGEGSASFNGSEQRIKSLVVYTTTQPTGDLNITVDNIRHTTSEDTTPPGAPRILTFEQGSVAGQAVVKWEASPDTDVASYRVYISNDSSFNSTEINRLTFPTSPVATVGADQQFATLSGLSANQNIYVAVTALDGVTTPNESAKSQILAARFNPDGSIPQNRIVMDNDRYDSASPQFISEGYFHGVIYTAQALDGLNRSFDSITDEAIIAGQADLTTSTQGVVIWSNLKDGEGSSGDSLTPSSLAKIEQFIQANGNLIISGSGIAEDITSRVNGPATLANVFKASLETGDITVSNILPYGPVEAPATLSTSQNPLTNTVAFATSSNDGIHPEQGSVPLLQFNGVPLNNAVAGIGYRGSLVFLPFAFETVGSNAGANASAAARQTLLSELIAFLTEETAAVDWQLFN